MRHLSYNWSRKPARLKFKDDFILLKFPHFNVRFRSVHMEWAGSIRRNLSTSLKCLEIKKYIHIMNSWTIWTRFSSNRDSWLSFQLFVVCFQLYVVCLPSLKKNTFFTFLLPASIFFKFKLPSLIYHFRSHTYLELMLSII